MKKYMPYLLIIYALAVALFGLSAPVKYRPVPSPVPAAEVPLPSAAPAPRPTVTPVPAPQPTPEPTANPGQQIADFAVQFEGYPYKYGEESPDKGFDCSGLVYYVYGEFGYPLYRTANDMRKNGEKITMEEALPGDILLFARSAGGWFYHCGIYLGDGTFIHASDETTGVVIGYVDRYVYVEPHRIWGLPEPEAES